MSEQNHAAGISGLTTSVLEVLACIAFRQPISQAEIDHLFDADKRGFVVTLRDLKLVEEFAGADGRLRFATTEPFLQRLGLASLQELTAASRPGDQTAIHKASDIKLARCVYVVISIGRAERAHMSFRARIAGEFPEEGLILRQVAATAHAGVVQSPEFVCEEWGRGWSAPIETGTAVVDAAKFDWERPYYFEDTDRNWPSKNIGIRPETTN